MEVSSNSSGTHSIQAIIEAMTMLEEEKIIRENVEPNIFKLCCNSNGTHIIQKIIICFPEVKREYVNEFIMKNTTKLCLNVHGVCVVRILFKLGKKIYHCQ